MNFSELIINSIKNEIDFIHNNKDSISPLDKIEQVKNILLNISEKKNILLLYINYSMKNKQN